MYIARNNEEMYTEKEFLGKNKEIFTWKNMNKIIFYSKEEEYRIKYEMQKYINKKIYTHIILP